MKCGSRTYGAAREPRLTFTSTSIRRGSKKHCRALAQKKGNRSLSMIQESRTQTAPPRMGVTTGGGVEATTIEYRPVMIKRASWGAIFGGMFFAMAVQA